MIVTNGYGSSLIVTKGYGGLSDIIAVPTPMIRTFVIPEEDRTLFVEGV